jgi:hypothetical protein
MDGGQVRQAVAEPVEGFGLGPGHAGLQQVREGVAEPIAVSWGQDRHRTGAEEEPDWDGRAGDGE